MGLLNLTEKELFNAARNEGETQKQYKARRQMINLATRFYLDNKVSNGTLRVIDYVRVIMENITVEY